METVFILHGNQNKIIRELQFSICKKINAIPSFPLFVRFSEKIDFDTFRNSKIEKCFLQNLFVESNCVFLKANISLKDKTIEGKLKLCILKDNKDFELEKIDEIKLPVFRLAKALISEKENEVEWEILEEKWKTLKKD